MDHRNTYSDSGGGSWGSLGRGASSGDTARNESGIDPWYGICAVEEIRSVAEKAASRDYGDSWESRRRDAQQRGSRQMAENSDKSTAAPWGGNPRKSRAQEASSSSERRKTSYFDGVMGSDSQFAPSLLDMPLARPPSPPDLVRTPPPPPPPPPRPHIPSLLSLDPKDPALPAAFASTSCKIVERSPRKKQKSSPTKDAAEDASNQSEKPEKSKRRRVRTKHSKKSTDEAKLVEAICGSADAVHYPGSRSRAEGGYTDEVYVVEEMDVETDGGIQDRPRRQQHPGDYGIPWDQQSGPIYPGQESGAWNRGQQSGPWNSGPQSGPWNSGAQSGPQSGPWNSQSGPYYSDEQSGPWNSQSGPYYSDEQYGPWSQQSGPQYSGPGPWNSGPQIGSWSSGPLSGPQYSAPGPQSWPEYPGPQPGPSQSLSSSWYSQSGPQYTRDKSGPSSSIADPSTILKNPQMQAMLSNIDFSKLKQAVSTASQPKRVDVDKEQVKKALEAVDRPQPSIATTAAKALKALEDEPEESSELSASDAVDVLLERALMAEKGDMVEMAALLLLYKLRGSKPEAEIEKLKSSKNTKLKSFLEEVEERTPQPIPTIWDIVKRPIPNSEEWAMYWCSEGDPAEPPPEELMDYYRNYLEVEVQDIDRVLPYSMPLAVKELPRADVVLRKLYWCCAHKTSHSYQGIYNLQEHSKVTFHNLTTEQTSHLNFYTSLSEEEKDGIRFRRPIVRLTAPPGYKVCDGCGSVVGREALADHKFKWGCNPQTCPACGLICSSWSKLKIHVILHHWKCFDKSIRKFRCPFVHPHLVLDAKRNDLQWFHQTLQELRDVPEIRAREDLDAMKRILTQCSSTSYGAFTTGKPTASNFQLDFCFAMENSLVDHILEHHQLCAMDGAIPVAHTYHVKCTMCKVTKTWGQVFELIQHEITEHPELLPMRCEVQKSCTLRFLYLDDLLNHVKLNHHPEKQFMCYKPQCAKLPRFRTLEYLRSHVYEMHFNLFSGYGEVPMWPCSECLMSYTSWRAARLCYYKHHRSIGYRCLVCSANFVDADAFNKHALESKKCDIPKFKSDFIEYCQNMHKSGKKDGEDAEKRSKGESSSGSNAAVPPLINLSEESTTAEFSTEASAMAVEGSAADYVTPAVTAAAYMSAATDVYGTAAAVQPCGYVQEYFSYPPPPISDPYSAQYWDPAYWPPSYPPPQNYTVPPPDGSDASVTQFLSQVCALPTDPIADKLINASESERKKLLDQLLNQDRSSSGSRSESESSSDGSEHSSQSDGRQSRKRKRVRRTSKSSSRSRAGSKHSDAGGRRSLSGSSRSSDRGSRPASSAKLDSSSLEQLRALLPAELTGTIEQQNMLAAFLEAQAGSSLSLGEAVQALLLAQAELGTTSDTAQHPSAVASATASAVPSGSAVSPISLDDDDDEPKTSSEAIEEKCDEKAEEKDVKANEKDEETEKKVAGNDAERNQMMENGEEQMSLKAENEDNETPEEDEGRKNAAKEMEEIDEDGIPAITLMDSD